MRMGRKMREIQSFAFLCHLTMSRGDRGRWAVVIPLLRPDVRMSWVDVQSVASNQSKCGTRITPIVQWPDKSFSLGLVQTLAWKRSGLMVRPSIQLSLCPTVGGSNPGLRAELIQSLKEKLSLICGFCCATHSTAFASLAIGRSKWNDNVGNSGIIIRLETPLNGVARPSLSIQLNSGVEF